MKTLHFGILMDYSGSMRNLISSAKADYATIVNQLKSEYKDEKDTDVIFHIGKFPMAKYGPVSSLPLEKVKDYLAYDPTGSVTPLYKDSITMINSLMNSAKFNDIIVLTVLTDGHDNDSSRSDIYEFDKLITKIASHDRFTIVFRVPDDRSKSKLVANGVPAGNIQIWETTTKGYEESTNSYAAATTNFLRSVKSGASTKSSSYFVDQNSIKSSDLSSLVNIASDVTVHQVGGIHAGMQIRNFIEQYMSPMKKGAAFYQLTKTEDKVQDYKIILVRDRASGKIYYGKDARLILGLPLTGVSRIVPGAQGNYEVYIQSTSVNRVLVPGTNVLYWPSFDVQQATQKPVVFIPQMTTKPLVSGPLHIPAHKAPQNAFVATVAKQNAKTRVRNRDTKQQQIRDWLYLKTNLKSPIKELTNYKTLEDLDIDGIIFDELMRDEFKKKFNVTFSRAEWLIMKTVGDLVTLGTKK